MSDTTEGIEMLEQWAREDLTRRYTIEWTGPVIEVNANGWRGGWKVMAWSARFPKRKLLHYLGGNSLKKAADRALARYRPTPLPVRKHA